MLGGIPGSGGSAGAAPPGGYAGSGGSPSCEGTPATEEGPVPLGVAWAFARSKLSSACRSNGTRGGRVRPWQVLIP